MENIVPSCGECNQKKGTMTHEEYIAKFPTVHKLFKATDQKLLSLAQRDEPTLEELRKESEGVSWAWRNPF